VSNLASELKHIYNTYPATPSEFEAWQAKRDELMDEVYEITGAEPKY
jgi:electron-transferring-flavoprotein dehydrogenase